MSRTFYKPFGKSPAVPFVRTLSFKETPENVPRVDHNKPWREWQAFMLRQNWWRKPAGQRAWKKHHQFMKYTLQMPAARERARDTPTLRRARVTFDPQNPYRPIEEWPAAAAPSERLTQFHQRYEYPYVAVNPYSVKYSDPGTPTGNYWRPAQQKSWVERGLEHPHDPHPAFFGLTYCVLLEDIPDLGAKADVVAVHPDQFRQELHPNKLAVVATRENCALVGAHYDPLYQNYPAREEQGKLMDRQPWVWDQLQGVPWDQFTAPDAEAESQRDQPWDESKIERPRFKADVIAEKKAEAEKQRAIMQEQQRKEQERAKGAAAQFYTL